MSVKNNAPLSQFLFQKTQGQGTQKPTAQPQSKTSGKKGLVTQMDSLPEEKQAGGAIKLPSAARPEGSTPGPLSMDKYDQSKESHTTTTELYNKNSKVGDLKKAEGTLYDITAEHIKHDDTPGVFHQGFKAKATLLGGKHENKFRLGNKVDAETQAKAALLESEIDTGVRLNKNKGEKQAKLWFHANGQTGGEASASTNVGNHKAGAGFKFNAYAKGEGKIAGGAIFDQKNKDLYAYGQVGGGATAGLKMTGHGRFGPLHVNGYIGKSVGKEVYLGGGGGVKDGILGGGIDVGSAIGPGVTAGGNIGFNTNWKRDPFKDPKNSQPQLPTSPHPFSQSPQLNRAGQLTPQRGELAQNHEAEQPDAQPRLQRQGQVQSSDPFVHVDKEPVEPLEPPPPFSQPQTLPLNRTGRITPEGKEYVKQKVPQEQPPFSQLPQLNRANKITPEGAEYAKNMQAQQPDTQSRLQRQGNVQQSQPTPS